MFICAVCNAPSAPREKPVKKVVEVRQRKMPLKGTEVVKEIVVHSDCAQFATVSSQ